MMENRSLGTHAEHSLAPKNTLRVFPDPEEAAAAAAAEFSSRASAAVEECGRFSVALSGGNTPRLFYRALVELPRESPVTSSATFASGTAAPVPWEQVHLFWGDERPVGPDDAESNFGMVREELLSKIRIPEANVHRLKGEEEPPRAVSAYERELRDYFKLRAGDLPRFDLILLGLGQDGHTASIFPGTRALSERTRLVMANPVEKLKATRLTLTLPVINEAACVAFLVAGEEKAPALKRVLEGPRGPEALPAQLVRPRRGERIWFVDSAAGSLLSL